MSPPRHMRVSRERWNFALCGAREVCADILGVRWKHTGQPARVTCKACLARLQRPAVDGADRAEH